MVILCEILFGCWNDEIDESVNWVSLKERIKELEQKIVESLPSAYLFRPLKNTKTSSKPTLVWGSYKNRPKIKNLGKFLKPPLKYFL